MIIGIGIDSVEIHRFADWHLKSSTSLKRIFSEAEINYCLRIQSKSAERFAARFAAREALFKALTPILKKPPPLLTLARNVELVQTKKRPFATHKSVNSGGIHFFIRASA